MGVVCVNVVVLVDGDGGGRRRVGRRRKPRSRARVVRRRWGAGVEVTEPAARSEGIQDGAETIDVAGGSHDRRRRSRRRHRGGLERLIPAFATVGSLLGRGSGVVDFRGKTAGGAAVAGGGVGGAGVAEVGEDDGWEAAADDGDGRGFVGGGPAEEDVLQLDIAVEEGFVVRDG